MNKITRLPGPGKLPPGAGISQSSKILGKVAENYGRDTSLAANAGFGAEFILSGKGFEENRLVARFVRCAASLGHFPPKLPRTCSSSAADGEKAWGRNRRQPTNGRNFCNRLSWKPTSSSKVPPSLYRSFPAFISRLFASLPTPGSRVCPHGRLRADLSFSFLLLKDRARKKLPLTWPFYEINLARNNFREGVWEQDAPKLLSI